MNRTLKTEKFVVAAPTKVDFHVATTFIHPVRGTVVCPAAVLVATGLERRRFRAVAEPLGRLDVPLSGGSPGVAYATTYQLDDGRAMGLAIAAAQALAPTAERTVRVWTEAMRSRRLLVVRPEACRAAASESPVDLPSRVPQVAGPDDGFCGAGAAVMCEKLCAARARLLEFEKRGDTVLLIGGDSAGLRAETLGWPQVVRVSSPEEAAQLGPLDQERLSFVLNPCTPVEPAATLLAALRVRFPKLRGQHPGEWCYRDSDYRLAADSVAAASDLLLSIGDRSAGFPTALRLEDLDQLRPNILRRSATVGLIDSGEEGEDVSMSALGAAVIEALSGLGPLSVVRRQMVTTEVGLSDGRLSEAG